MRIAVVNRHPSVALGGSETQCDLIATGLARRGHEVLYVAPGGVSGRPGYPAVGVRDAARDVLAALAPFRPDVVYWRFGTRHLAPAVRRLHRAGVRVVMAASHVDDLRALSTPPSARRPGPVRMLEVARDRARSVVGHLALLRVDGLVVNSPELVDIVRIRRRRFIPNSVDATFEPFAWPHPYVAWVANLKPAKRPEACIPLARSLLDLGVDVLMVGRPQVARYVDFHRRPDLPENLHVLGPMPPRPTAGLLRGALVHVHTCEPEGFPNVFLQAWCHGVPSVSLGFDPGGTIAGEGLGAVAGDDVERFHAATRHLISEPDARAEAGRRAAAHVTRSADPATNVGLLEEFLADVLGSP